MGWGEVTGWDTTDDWDGNLGVQNAKRRAVGTAHQLQSDIALQESVTLK